MKTVLLVGGSGFIGSYLCKKLQEKGYQVSILSRKQRPNTGCVTYTWNLEKKEIDKAAIEKTDYIINVAGENIGEKRWTKRRKELIVNSRVDSAEFIFEKVKLYNNNIKAYISASAVGYYGAITSEHIFVETDDAANDFLGNTCQQWEQAADQFSSIGIRTVKIRTGLVLASQGGALSKIITPIKMGVGSAIGTGKQYMPWIHIDDLCGIYIKAIEDSNMHGAYNAVADEHINNENFIKNLTQLLQKPFWKFNIPSIFMRIFLGEMSNILLKGSRVSNQKIKENGYKFLFLSIKNAFYELINSK